MPVPVSGQVGEQIVGSGVSTQPLRQGNLSDVIMSELHGRFYEHAYRGRLFSSGMTLTAISNITYTSATLGATCTPIIGLWNPLSSTVNAVLLQAMLDAIITAATTTGGAPFVWATSTGNAAISTGLTPLNRKTLAASGSQCKAFAGTALTGLTNNLVVQHASGLGGGPLGNFSFVGTAVGPTSVNQPSVENLDGSWIIPPGGVIALLATTTPVALSAASGLLWEENPL